MAFLDMSLEEFRRYQPAVSQPPDFDVFWADTLAQAERFPLGCPF
ncbi:MAG: acetylxylan esterase [Bellilinea sp.]